MLRGICPVIFTPFDPAGNIDERSLRRLVHFELENDINALVINGFASEAYKLSDAERLKTASIAADELAGHLPLVIGINPGSTEWALWQMEEFAGLSPAAFMILPPSTMDNGPIALVEHYMELGAKSTVPIMVQQSPHIPAYRHTELSDDSIVKMIQPESKIQYFKIEGAKTAEKIQTLRTAIDPQIGLFGGGGGITFADELRAGAAGLLPGAGLNEFFVEVWKSWQQGDQQSAADILLRIQPLIDIISGTSHEFSLHARKQLFLRKGLIQSAYVRRPTVDFRVEALERLFQHIDTLKTTLSL